MSSNKKLREFQSNEQLQSKKSEKERCVEDGVYNLENLFDTPIQLPINASESCHQDLRIQKSKEVMEGQHSNGILQASTQQEIQYINEKVPCEIFNGNFNSEDAEKVREKNANDHIQDTSTSTSVFDSDSVENGRRSSLSASNRNNVVLQKNGSELLLSCESADSAVVLMVDFNAITVPNQPPNNEISDDEYAGAVSFEAKKCNSADFNNPRYIKKSQNLRNISKKVSKNISGYAISKSFANQEGSICTTLKSSGMKNNNNFKMEIHTVPQIGKSDLKNQLINKFQNVSTITKFLPSLQELVQLEKNSRYPDSIDVKIYNKSEDRLQSLRKNSFENIKLEVVTSLVKKTVCSNNNIKSITKNFAQNIIEISKEILQTIQSLIFISPKTSSSGNVFSETGRKTDIGNNQNKQVNIKPKTHNEDVNDIFNESASTSLNLSKNVPTAQNEGFKYDSGEETEIIDVKTKSTQSLLEQSQIDMECSMHNPKLTKGSKKVSYLRRQMELYHLRVQVEQKRLQLLELKLAREWKEMQREKILFEKYCQPKSLQFNTSNDCVDI